jgi:hypothetical protein
MKLLYLKNLSPEVNKCLPKSFKAYITKNKLKSNVEELIFYDVSYELYKLLNLTYRSIPKEVDCSIIYKRMVRNEKFKDKAFTKILIKEKKKILQEFFYLSDKRKKKFPHEFFTANKTLYKYLISKGILSPEEYYYLKDLDDIFLIWVKLFSLYRIKTKIRNIKKNW